MSVLVYIETANGAVKKSSLEAASYGADLAKALGTDCAAVVLGEADNLAGLGAQGVTKVLQAKEGKLQAFTPAGYASALSQAMDQTQAKVLVLSHTVNGASLASRLAVKLNASLATNVISLPDTASGFTVKRGVYSGKALSDVNLTAERKIIAVKKNAHAVNQGSGTAEVVAFTPQLSDADTQAAPKETIKTSGKLSLPEADKVVSGGRGMRGPENWHLIEDLAEALGAATACSKPVSDVDWRPHHEHVGQTGITISPNLYIAVGISGAIQHLAGVNSSKVIVVINKDPEAPFFKAADYGIVGDVFEVLPKLIEAAKKLEH
jgi:electron transfer flavoprotein alpha subunit